MGVATAFPLKKYELKKCVIKVVADAKKWPYEKKKSGVLSKMDDFFSSIKNVFVKDKSPGDPWEYSKKRDNRMIFLRLRDIETDVVFSVSNYHMPCAYWNPPVMVIHCALYMQLVQQLADKDSFYIATGDFNIKPNSSPYRLIVDGELDEKDEEYPTPRSFDKWRPGHKKMVSAYAKANGTEPAFTNYSQVRDEPPFIDTLDYIFISPKCKVEAVLPLPAVEDVKGPLPIKEEPSDHILIGATLSLSS